MELKFDNFQETLELDNVASTVEKLLELYGKLMSISADYFELTGLGHTASVAEVKQACENFAQVFHPDVFISETNSEFAEIAEYVFDEMNIIFELLMHEAYRRDSA